MELINKNLIEAGKRIFNNKMKSENDKDGNVIISDEIIIKTLVDKAFTSSNTIADPTSYRQLNQMITTVAKELPNPNFEKVIGLLADYRKVNYDDTVFYDVNKRLRVTSKFTSTGSGVDFTNINSSKKKTPATPTKRQFGIKYSIADMRNDTINTFRKAVELVQEEKSRFTITEIYKLTQEASDASRIPTGQTVSGANVTFQEYKVIEGRLIRKGGGKRPFVFGDRAILGSLAEKQAGTLVAGTNTPMFLTDDLKESLLRDIEVEFISKSVAVYMDNPFTDRKNTIDSLELPTNKAILISGDGESPYKVTDYGDLAVLSDDFDVETEEAEVKISYKVDITLLLTEAIGYVVDTSVTF